MSKKKKKHKKIKFRQLVKLKAEGREQRAEEKSAPSAISESARSAGMESAESVPLGLTPKEVGFFRKDLLRISIFLGAVGLVLLVSFLILNYTNWITKLVK